MKPPAAWTPHTIEVAYYKGEGANGPVTGRPRKVERVFVKDQSETVTSSLGKEEVSRATVWMPLWLTPPTQSTVTVWPGTPQEYEARVFRVTRLDHPAWPNFGKVWLR